jgi:dTDP-4-dehydrorhamnose 3,5-epimerase
MEAEQTFIKGCFILHDKVFDDGRGYFFESFNKKRFFDQTGVDINFIQDNQSRSTRGVLRGLHFQRGEAAQAKLVRVIEGEVLDIAVDLRKDSPTFGQHVAVKLSGTSRTQFFIPRGFAHGFVVLSDTAVFFYKCDNLYNKQSEGAIIYNDPQLGINWEIPPGEVTLSEKDKVNPTLEQIINTL